MDANANHGEFELGDVPETQSPASKSAKNGSLDFENMAAIAGVSGFYSADPTSAITDNRQEGVEDERTNLPPYKKSLFKTLAIGGSLALGLAGVGNLVFGGQKQPEVAKTTPPPAPTEKTKEVFQPDPRFGVVASKLAMQKQQDEIARAAMDQQKASTDKAAADKAAANQTGVAPTSALPGAVATTPTNSTMPPQLVTNPNPPAVIPYQAPATLISAQPKPRTVPVSTPSSPLRAEPIRTQYLAPKIATVEPVRVKPVGIARIQPAKPILISRAQPVVNPTIAPVSWEVANNNAVGTWGKIAGNPISNQPSTLNQGNGGGSGVKENSKGNGVVRTALVGQQIRSKTITPYQSAITNNGTSAGQPLFVSLGAPILDSSGNILLPTGTQIAIDVTALDNGMLQAVGAHAAINGQLVDLGKQGIILQNAGKQPLMAEVKSFGGGEIFNRNIMGFLGGALGSIGKNLTQQQSTTVATAGGFLQTNIPQINITGAILDGGFSPLVAQWTDQNKAAVAQLSSQSKILFLNTGTELNVIVGQPFSL